MLDAAAGFYRLRSPDAALESLEQARRLSPERPEAWEQSGVVLERLGRVDEALEALEKAVELAPDRLSAWTNRAFLTGRHDMEAGLDRYAELLDRWPDDFPARHNVAVLLRDLGREGEALVAFSHASSLEDAVPALHVNLGQLHARFGRPDDARACYRRALHLDPEFEPAQVAMAALDPATQ